MDNFNLGIVTSKSSVSARYLASYYGE